MRRILIANHHKHAAFTLVEISVALVVLSIILTGLLPFVTESQRSNNQRDTIERLDKAEDALLAYAIKEGHFPCPAHGATTVHSSNFGVAGGGTDADADCMDAAVHSTWQTSSGDLVAFGSLPSRTLGLPDEFAFDGWKRRINYMISLDSIDDGSLAAMDAGVIEVGPSRTTEAVYAIWSSGPNGHGGFMPSGARHNGKSSNTDELDNCACTNNGSGGGTQDEKLVSNLASDGASPYDDITRFYTREQLQVKASGVASSGGGGGGGSTGWVFGVF